MSVNRMYLIWTITNPPSFLSRDKTYFYAKNCESLISENFSEATILDSHDKIWEMAEDDKYGPFKVHQASRNDIFKWQLMNELPRERQ